MKCKCGGELTEVIDKGELLLVCNSCKKVFSGINILSIDERSEEMTVIYIDENKKVTLKDAMDFIDKISH